MHGENTHTVIVTVQLYSATQEIQRCSRLESLTNKIIFRHFRNGEEEGQGIQTCRNGRWFRWFQLDGPTYNKYFRGLTCRLSPHDLSIGSRDPLKFLFNVSSFLGVLFRSTRAVRRPLTTVEVIRVSCKKQNNR